MSDSCEPNGKRKGKKAEKIKFDLWYVWRSPRPEDNHSIWRLANGELVEIGFYRKHPYHKKFLDYDFFGQGVFIRAI